MAQPAAHLYVICDARASHPPLSYVQIPARVFGDSEGTGSAPRVVSPMPGKVVKVLVKQGDSVKQGQPLVILEAMKMEHVISAPSSGLVEAVLKSVGDVVQDGVPLVMLKPAEK